MGTVVLTGATGFLGKHLFERLREESDSVFGLSQQKESKDKKIEKVDLTKLPELIEVMERAKPDVVYHVGALVDLSRDFEVAKKCIDINIKGTLNLLEACKNHVPKRIIFTSTEEVYGNGKIPYSEDQVPYPPSPYAVSKLAGEHLCALYAKFLEIELVIVRIGTMYGPGQPASRFIPQIIIKALRNEDIPLTSPEKKRDYIYVEDVVEALLLAGRVKLKEPQVVVNLGGGISFGLKQLIEEILYLTGSKSKPIFGKIPDRILEADEWLMDIEKAQKLLGWKPKTELSKGLFETMKYFKKEMV